MDVIVQGIVREGRIVPDAPLPEGTCVEVRVIGPLSELPPELREDFEAWGRASDRALELVDGPVLEGVAESKSCQLFDKIGKSGH
jgi:hypothetical protein